ncbi:MAG: hypothetical protein EOM50_17400 [Erysipelotrichia bacterium]|nr:hypothetical protein [Erysipelotrichia bacterium]
MGILGSGKKQEFKRGMDAGARPFEDKMTQLGEQVDDVKKELSNQINNFSDIQNAILTELSSKEKKELFDLDTEKSTDLLDRDDKEFALSILYSIADLIEETSDLQKQYIIRLQRYFEITEPNLNVGLSKIENLDDLATQKVLYQLVNEFVFLYNGEFYENELDEDLYDYFSLNKKTKNAIREGIERLVKIMGYYGLIEKYGYEVVEEIQDEDTTEERITGVSLIDETLFGLLRDYVTMACPSTAFAVGDEINLILEDDLRIRFELSKDEKILCGSYELVVTPDKIYLNNSSIGIISAPYRGILNIDCDNYQLIVKTESETLKYAISGASDYGFAIKDYVLWLKIFNKASKGIFEYKPDLNISSKYLEEYCEELENAKEDELVKKWLGGLRVYPDSSLGHRLFVMNKRNIPYDKIIGHKDAELIFTDEKIFFEFMIGMNGTKVIYRTIEFDLELIKDFDLDFTPKKIFGQDKLAIQITDLFDDVQNYNFEGNLVGVPYMTLNALTDHIFNIIKIAWENCFKFKYELSE